MHQIARKLWRHLMQRKGTILHANTRPLLAQPRLKQLNLLGCEICLVYLIAHFLTKWLHFFKHCNTVFNIKMLPQIVVAMNAFSNSSETQNQYLDVIRINKLISLWQKNMIFWKLFLFWSKMMSSLHLQWLKFYGPTL